MTLPLPTISPKGKATLDALLAKTVEERTVPAVFFGATNAKEELYFNSKGEKVFGQPEEGEVYSDTTLQLFSMTKFITTIASLQAVDRGLVTLDDADIVAKYCPEIAEMKILKGYTEDGKEILEQAKGRPTLRMLLSHNAGMVYQFNSPDVDRWRKEHSSPSIFAPDTPIEAFTQPLEFEPGTRWKYSLSIDWAAFVISRLQNRSLEDIFREDIFNPCGIHSMSFYPTDTIRERLMKVCSRDADGRVIASATEAFGRCMDPDHIGPVLSGGAGLFGTARDYLRLLRNVLASADPSTANPLITPASFKELFTNSLNLTPQVKADLAVAATRQNIHDPAVLANGTGEHLAHSVGLMINVIDSKIGRKAGSGCWDGAAKTMFWLDPTTGIGGVCCTNIMANNPDPFNGVYNSFERTLYDALEA
ncbi:beta-lactamase/transpeptidase-like protein [Naematelia encephala]|uniref:Beta-lactamase/transpeptidase-like protein n=1 Tax=Naematelia encephala TaxID=71784 RepID=A0A1Y2BB82_9TREE|nr:beta-lactamase/transpeptidase-like protein [Naematelia encephala]